MLSTRLTQEERDLVAQKYETTGISLRKMLAVQRMKVPSVGHLKHYDRDLPYIAYVRFQTVGVHGRAYKPVEFYQLLTEGAYGDIRLI